MSFEIVVSDAAGTRTLDENDLPLKVGTGSDADVRIPGAAARSDVALLGLLDGRAFVQVPGQAQVAVNGEAVHSTRWLEPGDELRIAGVEVRCELRDQRLEVRVMDRPIDYETAPPEADRSPGDDAVIEAARKRRTSFEQAIEKPRSSLLRNALIGVLLLLLGAALYLFTATTVVVRIAEGEPVVTLPGSWFTPGGNGRYLLWPGEYDVHIEAEGFFPLDETLVVEGGRQEFTFELEERPGRLQIKTQPPVEEGEVWIDGQPVAKLPLDSLPLPKGSYELRIRTERFLEYVALVEVEGRGKLQPVTAELVPGWADVLVSTEPPGAEVLSEGQLLGTTPATVELVAGTHALRFRKPGFRSAQRTITVVAGQQEVLPPVTLEEAGGLIRLSSVPSGSAVTIDGRFAGNTPLELEVATDRTFELRLTRAGYENATRSVFVPDNVPVPVEVRLKPRLGKVTIRARPVDAELYINGRNAGSPNQTLNLLAVPQQLEVRKDGFRPWVTQVTPKPGLPQQFDVELLTPEQARLAAIPQSVTTSLGQTLELIRPGEFMLGAPRREQGRRPNEARRPVRLTRMFYFGTEEVSNEEYRQFDPQHTSGAQKYRELAASSVPAVMVSWQDAAEYCNWLSKKEGLAPAYVRKGKSLVLADPPTNGYRLPTEAEWVWVARYQAGRGELKYPWGNGMPPPPNSGNYADLAAEGVAASTLSGYNDNYPVTSPGGTFPANELGVYDLGGNVAEWVNDRYAVTGGIETLVDPVGPDKGQYHVIRGSSWRHSSISELRLAYRDFGDQGRLDVGFRLARYVDEPAGEQE